MNSWQIQQAKARFSELIEKAQGGDPQFITHHGKRRAVLLSAEAFAQLSGRQPSFKDHLLAFPDDEFPALAREVDAEPSLDL